MQGSPCFFYALKEVRSLEYKQIRFKADVLDEEQGIFEGYASVFGNLDSGGDIVDPGAFARTLEENFELEEDA